MPTVLFLSDNAQYISDLGAVLNQRGHTLLVASSAAKAKRLLTNMPQLDLVLSPVDLDGGAVLSILCDIPDTDTPVVFYSERVPSSEGMPDDTVRKAVRLLGARKYFTVNEFRGSDIWWQIAEFFPDWTN